MSSLTAPLLRVLGRKADVQENRESDPSFTLAQRAASCDLRAPGWRSSMLSTVASRLPAFGPEHIERVKKLNALKA